MARKGKEGDSEPSIALIDVLKYIKNPQTEESFYEEVEFLAKHVVDRYRHKI